MGKRGPAGKPTNLRLLHGDQKKDPQRVNRNEPIPDASDIKPPTWLSKQARRVWRKLAPDLIAKKVLTGWDVEAFASYCDAVVRRAEAAKKVEEEGQVVELPVFNKNGDLTGYRVARNPWLMAHKDADLQAQRWGARFGLTPSERQDIKLPAPGGGGDDLLT
jgi:P27 family predicted phage terminase small subunit